MHSIFAAILLFAAPLAMAQATDVGWPREVKGKDGSMITVYQPQLERWERNQLSGRAAVSVAKPGEKDPRFGVIELTANTDIDKSADTVMLSNVRIAKGSFPGTSQEQSDSYLATLRATTAGAEKRAPTGASLVANPPIGVTVPPAMLVRFDRVIE